MLAFPDFKYLPQYMFVTPPSRENVIEVETNRHGIIAMIERKGMSCTRGKNNKNNNSNPKKFNLFKNFNRQIVLRFRNALLLASDS
jgi:hypothetical protein